MGCRRCGQCCNKALIIIDNCKLADEKNRDMAEWLTNHHCTVKTDDTGGGMAVIIPIICKYLEYDTAAGVAICLNYSNRPQICREYLCDAAEKDSK